MKIKKLSLLILVGLSSISVASNLPYHDVVLSASAKYGYDPLLIHAVIKKNLHIEIQQDQVSATRLNAINACNSKISRCI